MKLKCDEPLSSFAFNFNLRRYAMGSWEGLLPATWNNRAPVGQGLTLVRVSAQSKHILWDTLGA